MNQHDQMREALKLCQQANLTKHILNTGESLADVVNQALAHRDAQPAVAHNDAIGTVEVTVRGERRFEFNQNSTPLCLGVHQVYIDPRTHVDGAAQKLDKLLGQVINRRVMVEQKLFDMAAGKLPMPDADGLRKLAMELGDPAHNPQPVQPAGAQFRGYALLGSGKYILNHSDDFHPELGAELIITLATEKDKEGNRQIGETRDNPDHRQPIQPEDMVVRIGFLNERGLFALENQLAEIRKQFFVAAAPPAVAINEVLYQALRHLYHNAKKSGAEMGLALDVAEDALTQAEKAKGGV